MILPGKHIPQDKALLTIGAEVLNRLDKPKTVSAIWENVCKSEPETYVDVAHLSYDWFILAIDLLFAINAIEIHEGLLKRRTSS